MREKEDKVEFEGEVTEALRGRLFRVVLDNGHETYDLGRCRIVYRLG